MDARLRAAEAEVTATEKRMADFKRLVSFFVLQAGGWFGEE